MEEIREKLEKAILDLYGLDFEVEVTAAPGNIKADYSSNVALKLAKELHKSPMEIASEIADKLNCNVTTPGFLNFTLSDEVLQEKVEEEVKLDEYAGKMVICEFSDPNPFKVLHVGHLYTSIMGDAIARLYEAAGAKVVRANFGGDVGLHVAKTMYALKRKKFDDLTVDDIGKCYVEGTAVYEDDPVAKEEITKLNKEIYKINTEDIHGNPTADLYWKGRELSYEYFAKFYDSIGVKFDKYYPESSVAGLGLTKVKEELKTGVYEMSDGAVIFDGEKYGLHTRVFINKEGVPTYEAKDVGLIFQKWTDYHFDKSVVITGNEQKDYMQVVLKSVEQYAPELVEKTAHLTHGLVKLKGGVKMSSRKGNFLRAVEVLEMIREALAKEYGSHDEKVVLAATKYAFLKYKMGGDIIFDPAESVKMTGNSGPYLLYSAVRAKKILSKCAPQNKGFEVVSREGGCPSESEAPVKTGGRTGPRNLCSAERNLIKKLIDYRIMLSEAVAEMAPQKVATYLYELSQEFSRFYENCQVAGAPEEAERARLVKIYLETMTRGLELLGIEIPEEM